MLRAFHQFDTRRPLRVKSSVRDDPSMKDCTGPAVRHSSTSAALICMLCKWAIIAAESRSMLFNWAWRNHRSSVAGTLKILFVPTGKKCLRCPPGGQFIKFARHFYSAGRKKKKKVGNVRPTGCG